MNRKALLAAACLLLFFLTATPAFCQEESASFLLYAKKGAISQDGSICPDVRSLIEEWGGSVISATLLREIPAAEGAEELQVVLISIALGGRSLDALGQMLEQRPEIREVDIVEATVKPLLDG